MNEEKLINIKKKIEEMDIFNQNSILKIIKENNIFYTENKNGQFINLSNLEENIINKFEEYIVYYEKQNNDLINLENEKNNIKINHFNKEINKNIDHNNEVNKEKIELEIN